MTVIKPYSFTLIFHSYLFTSQNVGVFTGLFLTVGSV